MQDFEVKIDASKQGEFWEQLPTHILTQITWMDKMGRYQFRNADEKTFQEVEKVVDQLKGEILNIQSSVLEVLFPE